MVDLDSTVDEVKQQIREAEDPEYSELLEQEKEGKDRKTIKEFLEEKIDDDSEEVEEEVEEELVEEIEEETEGGILSGFTGTQLLAGGAMLGLVIGLIVGALALPMNQQISPEQAEQTVSDLISASGGEGADVVHTGMESGLHKVNVSREVTQGNQTGTSTRVFYVTGDGKLLIPESVQTAFGQPRPVVQNIDDLMQALEQRQQQATNQTQSDTNTTQPSENQTQ